MSLVDIARNLWLQIRNETGNGSNTAQRVGDAGSAILDALEDANKTISANTFADFDRQLLTGNFLISGHLNGFYIGCFNYPNLEQMIMWDNKIYTRNVNISGPTVIIPPFSIYGTSQPLPDVVDTESIDLSLVHHYTVDIDTAENIEISANCDNCNVAFPSIGDASKSITFVIPSTSNDIIFNGIIISAGNTVFCIYALGVWTINSTIIEVPVIPNYSDVSVQRKVDVNVPLMTFTGLFISTLPLVLGFSKNDIILLSNQTTKSEIGLYQILFVSPQEAILKLIVNGVALNTVRVEGDGAYQNQFDGFNVNTILFAKIGTGGAAKSDYDLAVDNGYVGTVNQWLLSLKGAPGVTPVKGIDYSDGTNGLNGTSVPVNFSFFKSGANGIVPMTSFSWISNLIVSQVILQDYASDISATINGTVYNKTTLIGVHLDLGVKMTNLDMIISAGQNTGSVTIIF